MKRIQEVRILALALAALGFLASASVARADYESDNNNDTMSIIERSLAKFKQNPAIYNGKVITPGATANAVMAHFKGCNDSIKQWNKYEKNVTAKGKGTPRFQAIIARVHKTSAYCAAMFKVAKPYVQDIVDRQAAASKARAASKATCEALSFAVRKPFSMTELYNVLDSSRGSRTPTNPEQIKLFRTRLDKLALVCNQPRFKNSTTLCRGQGIMLSSETNQRFNYGDLCMPTLDMKKTLQDAVMRFVTLSIKHGSRGEPTLEWFHQKDGWIRDTDVLYYKSYFQLTAATKASMETKMMANFDAAGVPAPDDMSIIWNYKQDYLTALKKVVDATIGEWKISKPKCRGYACNLAKKTIAKRYKGAKVKAVFASDWFIVKNSLGIPTHRSQGINIVYKVRGEAPCQARAFTVTEPYKGGGKYKKAKFLSWGYIRFQKC